MTGLALFRGSALAMLLLLTVADIGVAQDATKAQPPRAEEESTAASVAKFLAGGAVGLGAHEGGHLAFDVLFDAEPRLKRVDFYGIPFFAITHRPDLPRRKAFAVASAGFWAQHAGSEWVLTRRPRLRQERAPFAKGILAFNVLASTAYAGAAFARTGPGERDTRGMADASRIDERWIGALVLTPAVLDAWRYYRPDVPWVKWASRTLKVGMVILVVR